MKQYLVLFRGIPNNWNEKSEDEWMELGRKRAQWIGKVGTTFTSGKIAPKNSTVMFMKSGEYNISENHFDGTKEWIDGFFVVEAESMDHVVEMFKGCPWFQHDRVEIFEAEL